MDERPGEISAEQAQELYENLGITDTTTLEDGRNRPDAENENEAQSDDEVSGAQTGVPSDKPGQVYEQEGETGGQTREAEPSDGESGGEGEPRSDGESKESQGEGGSRGAQARIQELARQSKEWQEKYQELQDRVEAQKLNSEDPIYTLSDFKRVTDEDGDIVELTDEEAELHFLRWEKGYNHRQSQRQAEAQERAIESMSFYDEITNAITQYPQFDETSPQFDPELNAIFMEEMSEEFIKDNNGHIIGANISPMKKIERVLRYANHGTKKQPLKANRVGTVQPNGANSRSVLGTTLTAEQQDIQNMYKKLGIDPNK